MTKEIKSNINANKCFQYKNKEDLIQNVIDDCAGVLFDIYGFNSSSNFNDIPNDLCTEMDNWFDK